MPLLYNQKPVFFFLFSLSGFFGGLKLFLLSYWKVGAFFELDEMDDLAETAAAAITCS